MVVAVVSIDCMHLPLRSAGLTVSLVAEKLALQWALSVGN